ncbi:MAG TPA: CPBP family intramembrane glutamic endopeptidase [Xanthomonadales bacterium]|nr:CPBP family intramembrane glutamic endopeptidase [Xanthomonadales bacterium]
MKQLTPLKAAGLQLVPGLANLVVFVGLAYWFNTMGLPAFLALAATIMVSEVPVSWWLMNRITRKETGGKFDFKVAFPWRASIPWWQYLVIGLPLVIFGMVVIGGMTPVISSGIREASGLNVPAWFLLEPDPAVFASMSQSMLMIMWLASLVVFAGIGGFTQELYARGFLLPRTQSLGMWAPLFNAVMFAVFHLNAPWSWPGFAVLALPWAYLTWWKRSVKFGLVGHIGMLLMQSLMMSAIVFGLVPVDRMAG